MLILAKCVPWSLVSENGIGIEETFYQNHCLSNLPVQKFLLTVERSCRRSIARRASNREMNRARFQEVRKSGSEGLLHCVGSGPLGTVMTGPCRVWR
jgi:hypothetical protein